MAEVIWFEGGNQGTFAMKNTGKYWRRCGDSNHRTIPSENKESVEDSEPVAAVSLIPCGVRGNRNYLVRGSANRRPGNPDRALQAEPRFEQHVDVVDYDYGEY